MAPPVVDRNQHLTFQANAGAGRHRWLRLTPAYGVRLVRERISHLPPGSIVTDPFSGTGTTPLAAAEAGHAGQSIDVNPFLVWLGRVKTAHYSADACRLAVLAADAVAETARNTGPGAVLWKPALFRIERWWSPGVLRALQGIRQGIDSGGSDPAVRDLLDVALCRTLIAVSNAAFNHQSMSFKNAAAVPPAVVENEVGATLARFSAEVRELAADAGPGVPGTARIVRGDSRESMRELEPCDLLLTSPPYVNRMSYIRELRPYMYWLRFLELASDAGELDWRAIGGTWGTATSKLNSWTPSTVTPVDGPVGEVCSRIAAAGGANGPLLATYVGKYFHDMWLHLRAAGDHVKPGGRVSYIVGNSTFYGQVVPVEQWYAAMLEELGFDRVAVEIIRKRNSNKALYEYDVSAVR